MFDMTFGIVENEPELRMSQLRKLDEEHAKHTLYPECPRCEGARTIDAITRLNGAYVQPIIHSFSCPLCGGTGEADIESAEEWLLGILENEEVDEEDENYLAEREKIA